MNEQLKERAGLLKLLQDDQSELKTLAGLVQLAGNIQQQEQGAANFQYKQEVLNPLNIEKIQQAMKLDQEHAANEAQRMAMAAAGQQFEQELANQNADRAAELHKNTMLDTRIRRRDNEVNQERADALRYQQGLAMLVKSYIETGQIDNATHAVNRLAFVTDPNTEYVDKQELLDRRRELITRQNQRELGYLELKELDALSQQLGISSSN